MLVTLFVDVVGPLVWTIHPDMPLLVAVIAVSGYALALAFPVAPIASLVLVTVPIRFAALGALLATTVTFFHVLRVSSQDTCSSSSSARSGARVFDPLVFPIWRFC